MMHDNKKVTAPVKLPSPLPKKIDQLDDNQYLLYVSSCNIQRKYKLINPITGILNGIQALTAITFVCLTIIFVFLLFWSIIKMYHMMRKYSPQTGAGYKKRAENKAPVLAGAF